MKKGFVSKPEKIAELWPGEFTVGSWHQAVTAIPSPLIVVTGWKSNGKENACLQHASTFIGSEGEYICILSWVRKTGHMYQSLKETKCCVVNFPARDIADQCFKTIKNNGFDVDEITASGLTAEKAESVNAPRIAECFLNIECEYLWEHELSDNNASFVTVALKVVRICMDSDHYEQSELGRYGKTGYLYWADAPRNPDTGEMEEGRFVSLELYK